MLSRLARYLRGDAPRAIGVVATMLGVAGAEMLSPWPLKVVVDNVVGRQPILGRVPADEVRIFLLVASASAFVLLAVLRGSLQFLRQRWTAEVSQRASLALRADLYAQLHRVSLRFHDRARVGDLVTRLTRDVDQLQDAFVSAASVLSADLFVVLGIAAVMLLVDPPFALASLLIVPPLFIAYSTFRKRIKSAERAVRSGEGALASLAQEVLSAMRVVKAFGREPHERARFGAQSASVVEAGIETATWEGMFSFTIEIITATGIAVVLAFGGWRVLAGELSLGEMLVFLQYMRSLYDPVRRLSRMTTLAERAGASAERIAELFRLEPEVPVAPRARPLRRAAGRLVFEDVWFAYEDRVVLRGVDFDIEAGDAVAVVGPTGAGKSTLAMLIPRFYDPTKGRILLDGDDLRDLRLSDLRNQISVVLQDPLVFSGTIRENIAYARPDASDEEIRAAARSAFAEEFILGLAEGYDTVLGERGVTLSGGQRQRLGVARALLRDAPILILDEPTSAIDADSETFVVEAITKLARGRTVIAISHRQSLLALTTRAIAVREGSVTDVRRTMHTAAVEGLAVAGSS